MSRIKYTYKSCPCCENTNIYINDEDDRHEVVRVKYSCECGWTDVIFETKE